MKLTDFESFWEYHTSEPNYWLNKLPIDWDSFGKTNHYDGTVTLYLGKRKNAKNLEWEEDFYYSLKGIYINSKPYPSNFSRTVAEQYFIKEEQIALTEKYRQEQAKNNKEKESKEKLFKDWLIDKLKSFEKPPKAREICHLVQESTSDLSNTQKRKLGKQLVYKLVHENHWPGTTPIKRWYTP
jgi:hypothetical protein